MARLFGRRATLTVGPILVRSYDPISGQDGIPIQFKVRRTIDSTENEAEISVLNLNETTRGRMSELIKARAVLDAGYEDTEAGLVSGQATEIFSIRTRPGVLTQLKINDGRAATKARVKVTFGPGARVGDVIRRIAQDMGVSAQQAVARAQAGDFDGAINTFFNGFSITGTAKRVMDDLTRSLNVSWSIQDGELQILKPGETTQDAPVLLSPETGLIASPERAFDDKRPRKFIVRARSLLQPSLRPGRRLRLESADISGDFKISGVEHIGDSKGREWYSDVEALQI